VSERPSSAAGVPYRLQTVRRAGMPAVVLHDDAADLHATWVPSAGMLGASLVHRGEELLWQGAGVAAYVDGGAFMGVPFLHPWANRLERFGYQAGGHDVELDPDSPMLLRDDGGLPIHGVLTASREWTLRDAIADAGGARLTAVLFFDRPELLAAFPFPHIVLMEVAVSGGALQVRTTVTATGAGPVPVAFGFHPYLRLPGAPRATWEVSFPVRRRLLLDDRLIPTGEAESVTPLTGPIGDRTWDDGFDRFEGPPVFELRGAARTLRVDFAENFSVAQVFAPPDAEYVCVEPMTAPANALAGPDEALAWIAAGESRTTTFRVEVHDA
jgi:aldose 1-epimerase